MSLSQTPSYGQLITLKWILCKMKAFDEIKKRKIYGELFLLRDHLLSTFKYCQFSS